MYGDPTALRARAQLDLRALAAARPEREAVRTALEQIMRGDIAGGVDLLLDALRDDHSEASPARSALVAVLQMSSDEDFVRDTRRRMARVLF